MVTIRNSASIAGQGEVINAVSVPHVAETDFDGFPRQSVGLNVGFIVIARHKSGNHGISIRLDIDQVAGCGADNISRNGHIPIRHGKVRLIALGCNRNDRISAHHSIRTGTIQRRVAGIQDVAYVYTLSLIRVKNTKPVNTTDYAAIIALNSCDGMRALDERRRNGDRTSGHGKAKPSIPAFHRNALPVRIGHRDRAEVVFAGGRKIEIDASPLIRRGNAIAVLPGSHCTIRVIGDLNLMTARDAGKSRGDGNIVRRHREATAVEANTGMFYLITISNGHFAASIIDIRVDRDPYFITGLRGGHRIPHARHGNGTICASTNHNVVRLAFIAATARAGVATVDRAESENTRRHIDGVGQFSRLTYTC